MSIHYSEERQRKILTTLICPNCHAQNRPNVKAMLELDEKGIAYCNACGVTFLVDQVKES